MRAIESSRKFQKDLKRMQKRGANLKELYTILEMLCYNVKIPPQYKEHALTGNWAGCRDLHIDNDWLLIYEENEDTIFLYRTGTHSDLFK